MYEGELRKYNEGELAAYFKGADRLNWFFRDVIEKHMKKKINKEFLLHDLEIAYIEWEQIQNEFGLSEDCDFDDKENDVFDIPDDFI